MSEKAVVEHLERDIEATFDITSKDPSAALSQIDPNIEARIRRKYDLRILPIATFIYLMAFIDRSNMGNARVLGMTADLDLSGNRFNISLTAFFITYVLFEVPTNILCKKFGPRIWLALITFIFGLITMCLAFCQSFVGITVARTFLGIAEAGIMPGISYMLSTLQVNSLLIFFQWPCLTYRRHELGTRVGIYASFASLAGAFGGLLATGFSQIPPWGIMHTWRNIFFFEGIITMMSGLVCYAFLPDSPDSAKFLTQEEREIGVARIRLETLTNDQEKLEKKHFKLAIWNVSIILLSIALFCSLLCMNSIALFMPSLLSAMGYSSIQSQLMTVPPYAVGTVVCICLAMSSDRFKMRGPIIFAIVGPLIFIAFVILRTVDNVGIRYMAIFFATSGAFTGSPVIVAWTVDNTAGPMVRAIACAYSVSLGCLGGILATWTYVSSEAPGYATGHTINLCAGAVLIISALLASLKFRWENRQKALGKRDHVLDGLSQEEIDQLGHSHPDFKFTL